MKVKGIISQIVRWEQKEKYFCNMSYVGPPRDLLNISQFPKKRWSQEIKIWMERVIGREKPLDDYDNLIFSCQGDNNGLPIFVSIPHEHQVGDIVEIEIKVKKVVKLKL